MNKVQEPFGAAYDWIMRAAVGTGSARRLARLMLSLYNPTQFSFSVAECLACIDGNVKNWAMGMIASYADRGETAELLHYAPRVIAAHPDIVAEGRAMERARNSTSQRAPGRRRLKGRNEAPAAAAPRQGR